MFLEYTVVVGIIFDAQRCFRLVSCLLSVTFAMVVSVCIGFILIIIVLLKLVYVCMGRCVAVHVSS